jgi:hypothetical protein
MDTEILEAKLQNDRVCLGNSSLHLRTIRGSYDDTVTPFQTDPYNYSSYMASESNKIALMHGLSEKKHRQLVMDTIPSLSSAHRFFARSADLTDLFLMNSTLATSSLTQTDLEKAINAWRLDSSSQDVLFTSIMDLHSLLDRQT